MKLTVLLLGLFLALSIQGQSQNLTKKEKIKALFTLMHQDSLFIQTFNTMNISMVENITKMFNDTTYKKDGIDRSKMIKKLMEKTLQKSKEKALKILNGDMVDIYDKYFTVEEIDDFTVFYKSKSGQKMLMQSPNITKDIMNIMATKYQKDFQQSIMKDFEEMTKEILEQMKTKQK